MLRKFAFVHVEIHDEDKLVDMLKRRTESLVIHTSPSRIARVANFEHYSMTLRITSRSYRTPAVNAVRHLMVISETDLDDVVRRIALYIPMCNVGWSDEEDTSRLSYDIQMLKPSVAIGRGKDSQIKLLKPIFDYWSGENSERVRIVSTFDPELAVTLSERLKMNRWASMSEFLLAMERLCAQGETKHKLGYLVEAYRHWNEGIDLYWLMCRTKQFCQLYPDGINILEGEPLADKVRHMHSRCATVSLTLANKSTSAREKGYHADKAVRHSYLVYDWVIGDNDDFKRAIYTDMLKAYGILGDIQRGDGVVQDIEDPAARLRLCKLKFQEWQINPYMDSVSDNAQLVKFETTCKFMRMMESVASELYNSIAQDIFAYALARAQVHI